MTQISDTDTISWHHRGGPQVKEFKYQKLNGKFVILYIYYIIRDGGSKSIIIFNSIEGQN